MLSIRETTETDIFSVSLAIKNFECDFAEQAISFKKTNEISQKLVALPVLTFVELDYM